MQFSIQSFVLVAALFTGSTYAACDFFDQCGEGWTFCGATDTRVVCCDNTECGTSTCLGRVVLCDTLLTLISG